MDVEPRSRPPAGSCPFCHSEFELIGSVPRCPDCGHLAGHGAD